MGKTYYLDLDTLLPILGSDQYTLTASLMVAKKPAEGTVILEHGTITRCLVTLASGERIEGERAFRLLQSHNQWQVHFTPIQPPAMSPMSPTLPPSRMPLPRQSSPQLNPNRPFIAPPAGIRQKKPLDPALLERLHMDQRLILQMVLTQINGHRTANQIREQLNLPPATVDSVLDYLRSFGIIE